MMERYDIAVIGTGPAGLSAAITGKIRNKNVILIGKKELSMKITKAHTIQNYLGLPEIPGEELGRAYQKHLDAMGISITEDKINAVYAMGDFFGIQGAEQMYEATSVVLATGVVLGKPYPGENAFLGKGVSYCATCDAPLYKNKTVAVIGDSPKEEAEADFLAEVVGKVYYFPKYKEEVHVSSAVEVIYEKPIAIEGTDKVSNLVTNEKSYLVDGIFILRDAVAPDQLVPGIETENGHVKVDRQMRTNLDGCFACGDMVGIPYQYIKAAGEGNVAVLSAVTYLDQKKREIKE